MGAWGPGHLQSSAEGPRRLGRAGSEDSCSGPGGDVWIPRGGFGQSTFQCPFMPQVGHGPGGGLDFRHEGAQWPSLPHLKQGPRGVGKGFPPPSGCKKKGDGKAHRADKTIPKIRHHSPDFQRICDQKGQEA